MNREGKGGWKKGQSGNPAGRPPKDREVEFYRVTTSSVSAEDWRAIVLKAVDQARKGDASARKWLSDYLMGTPDQNINLRGELAVLWDWDKTPAV